MNVKDIVLASVVITICIAFLAVIGLAYLGKVDAQQIVTFVLTAVGSLLTGAGTWLFASKTQDARTAELFQRQRAEILSLKAKE